MLSVGWDSTCAHLEILVEGARGLRNFFKVHDLKSALAEPINQIVRGTHPERSTGSGELQIDDSVEDIIVKETHTREPAKIGKRGHFGSSLLPAMELMMNSQVFHPKRCLIALR